MYLRLRKRKKPLPTDTPTSNAVEPATGPGELAPPTSSDWVPAESAGGGEEGTDVSVSRHPNRGKAHESARGSHR